MDFLEFVKNENTLDLSKQNTITSLDISEMGEFLNQHPNITHLSLAQCFYNNEGASSNNTPYTGQAIWQLIDNILDGKLSHIVDFNFEGNNLGNNISALIKIIGICISNLEVLNLKNNHINDAVMKDLSEAIYSFPSSITILDLSYNDIGNNGITSLVKILPVQFHPKENDNSLIANQLRKYQQDQLSTKHNPFANLKYLDLSNNNIDGMGAIKLSEKVCAMPNLETLNLDSNQITIGGFHQLSLFIKNHNHKLTNLSVKDNPISTEAIEKTNKMLASRIKLSDEDTDAAINFLRFEESLHENHHIKQAVNIRQSNREMLNEVTNDLAEISPNPNIPQDIKDLVSSIQRLLIKNVMYDNIVIDPIVDMLGQTQDDDDDSAF